ncbi:M48 family metallopeptidase [Arenimonas sp. MALMAid1274]|uniref:M48 family metallopeptidase n=1 Tax=Arenimonas sp. MALMAid1274 TaxID=3411630 RepID=UPI003BA27747
MKSLDIHGLRVDVVRKPIRNLHLGVYPPDGRVRIAAPEGMGTDAIRLFAIGKLPWIRRQQARFIAQDRASDLEYVDRESHYVWGQRLLLRVKEVDGPADVRLHARALDLRVRPGTDAGKRRGVLEAWYRGQLRDALSPLLARWEKLLGVQVRKIHLQRMKTKWGSCNPRLGSIRLNTELARKPVECLEYILIHELVHLREPTHGARFVGLMDRALPQWRETRDMLNTLPLGHVDWVK